MKAASPDRLRRMTSAELEAEANRWLFGAAAVPRKSEGFQYLRPKVPCRNDVLCERCGGKISMGSASLCRACYRARAAKRDTAINVASYEQIAGAAVGFENGELVRLTSDEP